MPKITGPLIAGNPVAYSAFTENITCLLSKAH